MIHLWYDLWYDSFTYGSFMIWFYMKKIIADSKCFTHLAYVPEFYKGQKYGFYSSWNYSNKDYK